MGRRAVYRLLLLIATVFLIPCVPILIIYAGVSSPEYVVKGTLNLDPSEAPSLGPLQIYGDFLAHILRLDFGRSTSSGLPATQVIFNGFLESLKVLIPSALIAYLAGSLLGVWTERDRRANAVWRWSRPLFFIPLIVISYLTLFFISGAGISVTSNVRYLAAATVLAVYPTFVITNALKKTMREVTRSDFYACHRAMGFAPLEAWQRFCWKYVAIDYLSFFENLVIFMFGFLFFVEAPFGIDGMGYRFVMAVHRYDHPVIIGYCILAIVVLALIGLVVEVLKAGLDPRSAHV